MDKDHVFRPLYTIATLRDVDSPFIVGYDVFAQATDAATLSPMLARTEQMTGHCLKEVLVDSGYVTGIDLAQRAEAGVTLYGPWKTNDMHGPRRPRCSQGRTSSGCPRWRPIDVPRGTSSSG